MMAGLFDFDAPVPPRAAKPRQSSSELVSEGGVLPEPISPWQACATGLSAELLGHRLRVEFDEASQTTNGFFDDHLRVTNTRGGRRGALGVMSLLVDISKGWRFQ